jgi:peptidoglycan/xylan/chitin deacetylase (PgdA/CDA1 family)
MRKKRLAALFGLAALMISLLSAPSQPGEASEMAMDSAVSKSVRLPILMYHSILRDPRKADTYIATEDQFKKDLMYLKENGYETVVVKDLIDYVNELGPLPEKPVMITFDDGHYNTLYYALPILEELDMKAVLSIVGSYADAATQNPDPNPNYGYLSWDDVRSLSESGHFEIQNHSYAMHSMTLRRGAMRKVGESAAVFCSTFNADVMKQQQLLLENCGIHATAFAYPFGFISPETQDCLTQLNFSASFSAYERVNLIQKGNPDCLFMLGRFNRSGKISTNTFMKRLLAQDTRKR